MTDENVSPILAPDRDLIEAHLDFLFGRALTGRIEITSIHTDKEGRHAPQTRFFEVGDAEAADYAARCNARPSWNTYVGAALRNDDVFPGKAADDTDFNRTYALWADVDDGEDLAAARDKYRALNITPPFIVITGRTPSTRAQFWWPLDTPLTDIVALRAALRGIAAVLGSDPKVCTGKQLMRLAGTVNWPKKDDRILERTEVTKPPNAMREFSVEQLARAFPPLERSDPGLPADITVEQGGALGLEERVVDGRETYAFKLVRANLREWIGTTGSAPSSDELYRQVAPIYLKRADQVRPGRGPEFLKQKCIEALHAFDAGQIPGMRSLDEAVIGWAERHVKSPEEIAETDNENGELTLETSPKEIAPFRLADWTARRYEGEAKPIEWLCEGTIPLGIPVLFAAMGGMGKSFLALDLGLEIAIGVTTIGRRKILGGDVVQQGAAVILSAEDSRESIHRRLNKIDSGFRRDISPERLMVVPLPDINGPMPLIAGDGKTFICTPAFFELKAQLAAIPDLKLVVIDPLQAFVMADVNADPAAGQFMWSAFASLCAQTGATLIVLHHMRKEGSATINTPDQAREAIRGSSALVDGARLTYAIWKRNAEDAREVCARLDIPYAPDKIAGGAVVKANDEANRDMQVYVRQESGLLVDKSAAYAATAPHDGIDLATAQDIVTEVGKAFDDAVAGYGEGYAMAPQTGERQLWKLIKLRSNCSEREAKETAAAWVQNGILRMEEVSRKTKRLALRHVMKLG